MGLDIRIPMGLMFTILGVMVTGYGIFSDRAIYQRSLGVNVNLWWGLVLLVFGLVFIFLGRKGTSAMHPAAEVVEPEAGDAGRQRAENA